MRRRLAAVAAAAALALPLSVVGMNMAFAAPVFADSFDDGNANGWSRSGGSWSVVSGAFRQSSTGANARALAGTTSWTDYTVTARVTPIAFGSTARTVGVAARVQTSSNYYALVLTGGGSVQLQRVSGGTATALATGVVGVTPGTAYGLSLRVAGGQLSGAVNGVTLVRATDSTFASGRIGLVASYASAAFDDVAVETGAGPDPTTPPPTDPPPTGTCRVSGTPSGFATVDGTTTGGAGGPTVAVDTAAELLTAIARTGPVTICVHGTIALPAGMHDVASDKSIVGVGGTAGITGGGFNIGGPVSGATTPPADAVHNVIIQNLSFRNASDDSINVQMFAHHVWIDHNDLAQGYDGLIDIKRGSSYVTVSWNHTHHHTKNMLLGHDDSNGAQDVGRLKVSYHHNWFDATPQRNPRVRFGEPVHVYNNYFFYNTDTGVACQADAGCVVEGNYFENVEEPVTNTYAGPRGRCVARLNVFAGESGAPECSGTVQEPSAYYAYTLDDASAVKALVTAGAGVGKV
ncbi:pectate lyase [Asanoa sp. WMMD1127]|uniref:pectate lyase family protein n=1 Tax=Asanoa sp. WMMD1127 TaxID=3016107 RepID=UPI002417EFE1|nr:pectate lyase [Asanoa sp. WMMD1127]MDG4823908.1 pectate lyase [Asanoa sp. WMMD1127]